MLSHGLYVDDRGEGEEDDFFGNTRAVAGEAFMVGLCNRVVCLVEGRGDVGDGREEEVRRGGEKVVEIEIGVRVLGPTLGS